MDVLHITDLEAAINHWRQRCPSSPQGMGLSAPVLALTEPYVQLILNHQEWLVMDGLSLDALDALEGWVDTLPDTPCIAICSTSQGDDVCKGCGRTFEEVQHWLSYSPWQKRRVWRRITVEKRAWRFTSYAERAR